MWHKLPLIFVSSFKKASKRKGIRGGLIIYPEEKKRFEGCRCEGYVFQAVYSRIGYINQSVWF